MARVATQGQGAPESTKVREQVAGEQNALSAVAEAKTKLEKFQQSKNPLDAYEFNTSMELLSRLVDKPIEGGRLSDQDIISIKKALTPYSGMMGTAAMVLFLHYMLGYHFLWRLLLPCYHPHDR